jgi:hypothetical protein
MLASRKPKLFNESMESKSPLSASRLAHGDGPRPALPADWQPSTGIVDRMLAYREWWNIPEGGAGRGPARPGTVRNRIRSGEHAA